MSFYYFLPGPRTKPDADRLAAAGLAYAFDGPPCFHGVVRGPEGQEGVCLHNSQDTPKYVPDAQDWRPILNSPAGAWIGRTKGLEITPADLARPEQLAGYRLLMADGHKWVAPIARAIATDGNPFSWSTALPQRCTRDTAGHWVPGDVVTRYAELWGLAADIFDDFAGQFEDDEDQAEDETTPEQRYSEDIEAAVLALSYNYRLAGDEADWLGIFTRQTALDVHRAMIDWPRRLRLIGELEKKTDQPTPDTSPTEPGQPDAPPTTAQP